MLTCIDCDTMQCIAAENCYDVSKNGFVCIDCHCSVVLVLEKKWPAIDKNALSHSRFFRHKVPNPACGHTLRNPQSLETSVSSPLLSSSPTSSSSLLSETDTVVPVDAVNLAWQEHWNRLRPTPCISTELHDCAVVLQDRDYPEEPPITIFNATRTELFAYGTFQHKKQPLFFCCDNGIQSPKDATVLVHCSDNRLLQTCSESVVVMMGQRQLTVRFFTQMDDAMKFAVNDYFKGMDWPPRPLQIVKCTPFELPLQVLSVEGRLFVDTMHRDFFKVFPTKPLTIFNAGPGSGKTTALKQAVRAWKNKKVLIIIFNKSNQEALQAELKGIKGCTVRTLDALIASVTKCRFEPSYDEGMDEDEQERLKAECNDNFENEMESEDPTKMYDDCVSGAEEEEEEDDENVHDDVAEDNVDEKSQVEELLDFDANFSDASFSKSCYDEWHYSDHMKYGGGSGAASLMQARLTHPKAKVHICKNHARLSLRHASDNAKPWNGCHYDFPLKRIIDSQSSFAARRYVADRDKMLVDVLGKYDLIVMDECQDLTSSLEMRLIMQSTTPVVCVGDNNQSINSFVHQINDFNCDKRSPCKFPMEVPHPAMPTQIQWYSTYRLCPLTVSFLEDMTNIIMVSKRTDKCMIRWQTKITEPNTLVMTRSHESVVKVVLQYQKTNLRVMAGVRIASMLKAASMSVGQNGLAKLARKLKNDGLLTAVLKFLTERDISIKELKNTPTFCVSTIHMLKGFECDNTAVHMDIIQAAQKETCAKSVDRSERCVAFVALSRHKKSLTILFDIPEPVKQAVEPAKIQITLDLSKFIYKKD